MAFIETGDPHDGSDPLRASACIDTLRIGTGIGGLILLGPTAGPVPGIDMLLASPEVEPLEVSSAAASEWKTATNEMITVTRRSSQLIRGGRTPVVYLDTHRGLSDPLTPDTCDFISARLGQIMIGLADVPAYVGLHGERMAQTLVIDSLGDENAPGIGIMPGGYPVWELTNKTMFAGVPVAVCPADEPVTAVTQMFDWFEARRVSPVHPSEPTNPTPR